MSSLKKMLFVLIFGIIYSSIESYSTSGILELPNNEIQIEILSKEQWKAEPPLKELSNLSLPVSNVIISHTVTEECDKKEICVQKLRAIQKYHMDTMKFDDIAYNFLISNDGKIYEGRGWNKVGAHTKNYNNDSIGIALMGNYEIVEPTEEELLAIKNLIEYGVSLGKITQHYRLYGQKQLRPTKSPGQFLYDIIKTWSHWAEIII